MKVAFGAALVLAACSRSASPSGDAGGDVRSAVEAAASSVDAAPFAAPAEEAPPATFVGARRAHLAKLDDEPGLAKNADAIRAHFDGGIPPSMDLQAVSLGAGKQALLLSVPADDPRPIALLVDADGVALWIKGHPLGGITPPARPFAIAPRPDGGVALFVYDEPTKLVAGRMWDAAGGAFAELMLFELSRCDAISAAWWPGRGWIVVTSFPGGARAQLVGEDGNPTWGAQGVPVGEAWRAPAPATIVIEPESSSWLLFQHATRGRADHVVALRYGPLGERVGASAIDLSAVARVAHTADRIEASLARPGVARLDLDGKSVEASLTPSSHAQRTP